MTCCGISTFHHVHSSGLRSMVSWLRTCDFGGWFGLLEFTGPSGNRLHKYGKISIFLMGKFAISMAMLYNVQ